MLFQTFAFAQYSRTWQGTDVPGHIQASFTELNGTQSFKIMPSTQKARFLKYNITREAGELTITIKSTSGIILSKKISSIQKDSISISDPSKELKVEIKGLSADGKFDIRYSD